MPGARSGEPVKALGKGAGRANREGEKQQMKERDGASGDSVLVSVRIPPRLALDPPGWPEAFMVS